MADLRMRAGPGESPPRKRATARRARRARRAIESLERRTMLSASAGTIAFDAPIVRTLGNLQPTAAFIGDFNGDGKADLVVQNAVLLGNGDGTFGAGAPLPTPAGIGNVRAIADLNHDGKLDVIGDFGIALGNGDGTFQEKLYPAGTPGGGSMDVADVNGDGVPDIVLGISPAATNLDGSNIGPADAYVLLGRGDGTFQPSKDTPLAKTWYSNTDGKIFALGDFNGDGKIDLLSGFGLYAGKGDGTFSPPAAGSGADNGTPVGAAADFNGDGKPDALGDSGGSDDAANVNLNDGAGNLMPGFQGYVGRTEGGPEVVSRAIAADVNGDGKLDLVQGVARNPLTPPGSPADAGTSMPAVVLTPGNGDGTFATPIYLSDPVPPQVIAVGDVNGDGRPDVVTIGISATTPQIEYSVSTLLAQAPAAAPAPALVALSTGENPAALADFVPVTAAVHAPGGAILTDGFVTFFLTTHPSADATSRSTLITVPVGADGTASFVPARLTNDLGPGTYSITASYGGDAGASPAAAPAPLNLTLTAPASSISVLQGGTPTARTYTLSFIAGGPSGSHVPSGIVSFYNGTTLLGTQTVPSDGKVAITVTASTLGLGQRTINVHYTGGGGLPAADLSTTISVTDGLLTNTDLTASLVPASAGMPSVTFTASVIVNDPSVPPFDIFDPNRFNRPYATGTVAFFSDGTQIGKADLIISAAVLAYGQAPTATFTTDDPRAFNHAITARYEGVLGSFAPSDSAPITEQEPATPTSTPSPTSTPDPGAPTPSHAAPTTPAQWAAKVADDKTALALAIRNRAVQLKALRLQRRLDANAYHAVLKSLRAMERASVRGGTSANAVALNASLDRWRAALQADDAAIRNARADFTGIRPARAQLAADRRSLKIARGHA